MKKTIILIVLAVVLALIAGFMLGNLDDENDNETVTPTPVPTQTQKPELDPGVGELVTPTPVPQLPGVAIPGWGSITLPAGVTEAPVSMGNPEANEGWYYLTFELRLKDTGEVIFTSGLVPPGMYLNSVTLTRELEPGEYPAIMHVQPYLQDEELTPVNNADLETVLIVK